MNYIFENIQFNSEIPIKIFIHNLNYAQNHWHDALEILFVLDGTIHIGIGNSVYQLHREDLIVINPHEIHTTYSKSANLVLALQISSDWINKYTTFKDTQFSCNSSISEKRLHMDIIRKLLAQMMWVYNNQSSHFELRLQSYFFELLYQLFIYFKTEKQQPVVIEMGNYMPRLSNIVHYLHENYNQNITLQDLADREFLTVSYLSRFFKKHIGTSYKEYVIRLRLEHAVKDLLFTDKPITQLALDNGFPNTNSFLDSFREMYNETPSVYRKKAKEDYEFLYGPKVHSNNYFEIVDLDVFSSLYKYLNEGFGAELSDSNLISIDIDLGEVNLTCKTSKIEHHWKNLLTIGKAKDVLEPKIQEQLSMVQEEIGFRFIRFHGIFDDELMVYHEDESGNPFLDFGYIDQVIDYLYKIKLKPFIELSFMPIQLAKSEHTMFENRPSIISMPKDIKKWCYLVKQFIVHCINRYGANQVKEWYFEFWNEPDLKDVFWYDSFEDYLHFYAQTYNTIKSISNDIIIGGPAICNLSNMEEWLLRYFEFCQSNSCLPDFFSFHFYLHRGILSEVQNFTHVDFKRITLSNDSDYMQKTIKRMKKIASAYNYDTDRIHLTEWNASPSHRDLSHDTIFMAAYIIKNILENMDCVKSFGFWTISDFIEEFQIPEEIFHGGLGVITSNGIKKAGYYAFSFLNQLGDQKIASGPGFYVTRDSNGYQIIMYNYFHYDQLYCNMDHSGISNTERYGIFKDALSKNVQINLIGFKSSNYEIKEYSINRNHGSAFDTWVEMRAPEKMTYEKIEYIRNKSTPSYTEWIEHIHDSYLLQRTLMPHEICFISIQKTDESKPE